MASPFSYFRKHMKAMLALLTVLVMGGFVVLPIVMKTMDGGGGGSRGNIVVVSTNKYGNLKEYDIDRLQSDRGAVQMFLRQVAGRVTPDPRYAGMTVAGMFMRNIGSPDEENVVNTWLLARHAQDLGLVVTDQAVEAFLQELVEGKLDGEEIETILAELNISVDSLYGLLRHELLAYHTGRLFQASIRGSTPAQRWDYYKRLNRKVAIEAVEFPVEQFVSQVPEADPRELEELFEEYKNQEPNPSSPDPGFRVPAKIAIEYFKADADKLVERAEISESEIAAYYEENKEQRFKRGKFSLDSETDLGEPRSMSVPALDDGVESLPGLWEGGKYALPIEPKTEPEAELKPEPKPEPKPEAEPEQEAEPEAQAKPTPADQSKTPAKEETPPADKPSTSEPTGPEIPAPGGDEPKTPSESKTPGDTSSLQSDSPFRLASYAEEEAGQPTAEKPENPEKPASAAGSTEETSEKTPQETDEETPKKTPENRPADAGGTPDDESIGKVVDSIVGEQPPAEESEYDPLEKVEDQIKRTLAIEKLQEALMGLQDKMSAYRREKIPFQAGTSDKEPQKLNFEQLAKENVLSAYKTDLIPAYEAQKLDIGKSTLDGGSEFLAAAFGTIAEWRPTTSQDDDGSYYLFWILEKTEGRLPEFDDPGIREQVEETWKMIQAREPATQAARQLAEEAIEANPDKSLKEIFPGRKVIQTEPFSWMTYGNVPIWMAQAPPSVSEIILKTPEGAAELETGEAVVAPGNHFMRDVSVLEKGQVGVATNQPETAVYLVRITDVSPLRELLWQSFLTDDYRRYSMVSYDDQMEQQRAWYEAIKQSTGFEWSGREPRRR